MVSITPRLLEKIAVLISICILLYLTNAESKPLSKRAINEVQLMHNVGVHKHVELRQDWLQMKLREIHTASIKNAKKMDPERPRLPPEIIPKLKDLNSRETEDIMTLLEKLMNP